MVDANILVALFVRGGRHPVAHLAAEGLIRPVLCEYMVEEARRMVKAAFPVRAHELDSLLAALNADRCPSPSPEDVARFDVLTADWSDHPVLAASRLADVDYLVTSDRALREEASPHLDGMGSRLAVVSVTELLERVRSS